MLRRRPPSACASAASSSLLIVLVCRQAAACAPLSRCRLRRRQSAGAAKHVPGQLHTLPAATPPPTPSPHAFSGAYDAAPCMQHILIRIFLRISFSAHQQLPCCGATLAGPAWPATYGCRRLLPFFLRLSALPSAHLFSLPSACPHPAAKAAPGPALRDSLHPASTSLPFRPMPTHP